MHVSQFTITQSMSGSNDYVFKNALLEVFYQHDSYVKKFKDY